MSPNHAINVLEDPNEVDSAYEGEPDVACLQISHLQYLRMCYGVRVARV